MMRSEGYNSGPTTVALELFAPGDGVFVGTQSYVGFAVSSSRLFPEELEDHVARST